MRARTGFYAALLAGVASSGSAAMAQDTPGADSATADIIVTAQKRAERLENVPISITAASAENLERGGIQRLEDIGRIAPGVQIARVGVYSQPSIRGVTTALSATPENNVATYVDGVYIRSSRGLNMDLVNISSVQVLKGPQGTLFGRNATGGAILVETLQPSLDEVTGRASVGVGSFNEKRAQGYLSVPLGAGAAISVSGSARKNDGYIRDIAGFNTAPLGLYSLGTRLRLEPSDDFSVTAKLDWSKTSDGRSNATTMVGRSLGRFLNPTLPVATSGFQTSLNHPVTNRAKQVLASLKLEYRFDGATLTSISSYQNEHNFIYFEGDGSKALIYDERNREDYKTLQQEFNLTSTGDGPLQYVLGLYYFDGQIRQHQRYVLGARQPDVARDSKAYAAFADLTYQLGDKLFLTAGLRYSHEEPRLRYLGLDNKLKFNSVTPRAVVRYEVGQNSNVYASYAKGFKSGQVDSFIPNPTVPVFSMIKPEKIDAWEVGFKTNNGGLHFDAAAYYYDYRDLQVGSVIIINGVSTSATSNAATAEIYGAEAALSGEIAQGLNLSSGIAYTHARYKKFPNAVVASPSPTTGLNVSLCGGVPCTQDWSGQRIVRSPDWTINVGLDYTVSTGIGELLFAGNGTYTSSFSPQKSDIGLDGTGYRYEQGPTFLLNLRAALTLPGDAVTLAVFGRNVTDEVTYITNTGNAFGDYRTRGEPSTWGVSLDYRF